MTKHHSRIAVVNYQSKVTIFVKLRNHWASRFEACLGKPFLWVTSVEDRNLSKIMKFITWLRYLIFLISVPIRCHKLNILWLAHLSPFSRARGRSVVYSLSPYWLPNIHIFGLIGCCSYFGFHSRMIFLYMRGCTAKPVSLRSFNSKLLRWDESGRRASLILLQQNWKKPRFPCLFYVCVSLSNNRFFFLKIGTRIWWRETRQ